MAAGIDCAGLAAAEAFRVLVWVVFDLVRFLWRRGVWASIIRALLNTKAEINMAMTFFTVSCVLRLGILVILQVNEMLT